MIVGGSHLDDVRADAVCLRAIGQCRCHRQQRSNVVANKVHLGARRELRLEVRDPKMTDSDLDALFHEDMLGDDLEAWLGESTLMKSTFSKCAVIAGMINRNTPGADRKTGRQVTFSADLIYDVLKQYEPDHILMQAAFADAGEGYLDIKRVGALLARIKGKIVHRDLPHVSPFAAPVTGSAMSWACWAMVETVVSPRPPAFPPAALLCAHRRADSLLPYHPP